MRSCSYIGLPSSRRRRELTLVVLRRNAPPAPWVPEAAHGKPIIVIVACHSGTPEQAQADLAPIKSHGQPLADLIQVKPYVAQQSMLDATQPKGMHYYWKSEFLGGLSDDALRDVQRAVRRSEGAGEPDRPVPRRRCDQRARRG